MFELLAAGWTFEERWIELAMWCCAVKGFEFGFWMSRARQKL